MQWKGKEKKELARIKNLACCSSSYELDIVITNKIINDY